ncbi:hypothetical protein [Neptuniibacter marinus]|uniref:hypothetical protein n=1 Tax=Neptuniibacter marinus TaxID=1806670 RepID=UPI0008311D5A|nr:hypothetical protein [Neptuniibacter marinus]
MAGLYRLQPILMTLLLTCISFNSFADALIGKKQVLLVDKKGQEVLVGDITFSPEGEHSRYKLHMNHDKFKDFFLSMKEMKCLEGPELWCHLAYPYQQPHKVSSGDMSWLSHDLLFMFKKKKDFGANFWNGIYYDMRIDGESIRGEAQAIDLNVLASPPDDLNTPPIGIGERDEIDRNQRWLPDLIIR